MSPRRVHPSVRCANRSLDHPICSTIHHATLDAKCPLTSKSPKTRRKHGGLQALWCRLSCHRCCCLRGDWSSQSKSQLSVRLHSPRTLGFPETEVHQPSGHSRCSLHWAHFLLLHSLRFRRSIHRRPTGRCSELTTGQQQVLQPWKHTGSATSVSSRDPLTLANGSTQQRALLLFHKH